jgi:hypothetical protein
MTMAELDDLVAVRGKAVDAASTQQAILKIEDMIAGYTAQANGVRDRRKASLLKLPAEKLIAMENEARALDLAAEQGAEILGALRQQNFSQQAAEAAAQLLGQRDTVLAGNKACQAEWNNFYGKLVPEFLAMLAKVRTQEAEVSTFNSLKRDYDRRWNQSPGRAVALEGDKVLYLDTREEVPAAPGRVVQNVGGPVNPHLLARICLPDSEFDGVAGDRVPLAYAGSFIRHIMQQTALSHGPAMPVPSPAATRNGPVHLDQDGRAHAAE